MSCEWDHQYCLACDRQTDGRAYCSQACRLADFEKSSPLSFGASFPSFTSQSTSWTMTPPRPQAKFWLSPAYDFSNPSPYGTTPQAPSLLASYQSPLLLPTGHRLSSSNSHTSLCSMQSSTSSTSSEASQLCYDTVKELKAYESLFAQVRTQRQKSF